MAKTSEIIAKIKADRHVEYESYLSDLQSRSQYIEKEVCEPQAINVTISEDGYQQFVNWKVDLEKKVKNPHLLRRGGGVKQPGFTGNS